MIEKQFIMSDIKVDKTFSFDSPAVKFRKKFVVENTEKAVIYVCGLGYGYFFLNGKKIADDLFTAPVSDYKKRVWYNRYDVSTLLNKGENIFAAIVGNGFYNENFNSAWKHNKAQWRDTPKVFVSLFIGEKRVLLSDKSFLFEKDRCIYFNQLRSGEYKS